MANTTNFGWETPDDTDLVKDGAAAIRTLGSAIDTSLVDLKGGTTGQVLAKASNTDMDFTWSSVDPLTILDAKGDLISATAADTPARLAVGTDGQVLIADSSTSTGLKWGTPAAGGMTLLATTTLSGSSTTISAISQSYKDLLFIFRGVGTNGSKFQIRLNGITTSSYYGITTIFDSGSPNGVGTFRSAQTLIELREDLNTDTNNTGYLRIYDYAGTSAAMKYCELKHFDQPAERVNFTNFVNYDVVSTGVSSITFLSPGTISGTVLTYGVS